MASDDRPGDGVGEDAAAPGEKKARRHTIVAEYGHKTRCGLSVCLYVCLGDEGLSVSWDGRDGLGKAVTVLREKVFVVREGVSEMI